MTGEWDNPADVPRRSRRWLWALLAVLVVAIAGAAAGIAVLQRWPLARSWAGLAPATVAAVPARIVVRAVPAPAVTEAPSPETARRLARVEQGLARVDARAIETSSNAERAEGLLVAFAARRALDRGTALGYIEGLLRERFGGTQPQAVATILSASRTPVTLSDLQTAFDAVGPTLVSVDPQESWWDGVRREFAGLVVVRRASVPSTQPADRLLRARRQLEEGHVDLAMAEVLRMPGRDAAAAWTVQARRYVMARRALDAIETAALLAPARTTPAVDPTLALPITPDVARDDQGDPPAI